MSKVIRGYALFINWFNGVCAVVFGSIMMLSNQLFPSNTESFMPLEMFDNFPFHDLFFTSLFWPGLALVLVNGVPNIIALVLRFCGRQISSYTWGMVAGGMLIVWTVVEMIYMPNTLSIVYLIIGVLQLAASGHERKQQVNKLSHW